MSKEYRISFASITILDDQTASIKVDQGIEVSEMQYEELKEFELKHLQMPRLLLVDKENSYSYSFMAQRALANTDHIWATAGLIYSEKQKIVSNSLRSMADDSNFNSKTFYERESALTWLHQQRTDYLSCDELPS